MNVRTQSMFSISITLSRLILAALFSMILLSGCGQNETSEESSDKPVLLYSNYYNAEGENRYPADGNFSEIMKEFSKDFQVRVHADALTAEVLSDVKVVFIANPNDKAVDGFSAPPHVSAADIKTLTLYVKNGGGIITSHNQANHNLETVAMNRLLGSFGIRITDDFTGPKAIRIPEDTPVVGGLLWAYIIGDSIKIDSSHPASPHSIVTNDLSQKPLVGDDNAEGILMAGAELGNGRVMVTTDSGWFLNAALNGEEAGGVVIESHDNREIARRLARWVGGL